MQETNIFLIFAFSQARVHAFYLVDNVHIDLTSRTIILKNNI